MNEFTGRSRLTHTFTEEFLMWVLNKSIVHIKTTQLCKWGLATGFDDTNTTTDMLQIAADHLVEYLGTNPFTTIREDYTDDLYVAVMNDLDIVNEVYLSNILTDVLPLIPK